MAAVFAMRINEVTSNVGGLYDVGGVTCAGRFARSQDRGGGVLVPVVTGVTVSRNSVRKADSR